MRRAVRERNPSQAVAIIAYFCLIIALFAGIAVATSNELVPVKASEEISSIDLSAHIAHLEPVCFSFYPDQLYTPEDFAAGIVPDSSLSAQSEKQDTVKTEYATYRALLPLRPGVVYGLLSTGPSYSARMWINGAEHITLGTPGVTADTTDTLTRYFATFFEPKTRVTEIVIQRANFYHYDEGILPGMRLGRQEIITAAYARDQLWGSMMIGCMLMSMMFFLGFFLFFPNRLNFLWFALACLMIAIRTLIIDHKMIMLIFPRMPWAQKQRMEYAISIALLIFFFLYINRMFDIPARHPVIVVGLLPFAGYLVVIFLGPTIVFTRFLKQLHISFGVYAIVDIFLIIRNICRSPHYRRDEYVLIFLGTIVCVGMAGVDIVRHGVLMEINLLQVGMVAFVLSNALAQVLGFLRTQAELNASQKREAEMRETNEILDRLNVMKTRFMGNISHEMRTPLAVMSANAQLSKRLLEKGMDNQEVYERLDIVTAETERLARLVSETLSLSAMQENAAQMMPIDIAPFIRNTAEVYSIILGKNGNSLIVDVPEKLPEIRANADMLVQVLVNLLTNAATYTKGGSVTVRASVAKDITGVQLEVSDTGIGIMPELLTHAFDRHTKDDRSGGAGFGLAICKVIVEKHSGTIELESEPGNGTTVRLWLPIHLKGIECDAKKNHPAAGGYVGAS